MSGTIKRPDLQLTDLSFFLLTLLMSIHLCVVLLLAIMVKPGIQPDEPVHIEFSRHFATTLGIPSDIESTYKTGSYIRDRPFLYYWINGRILNIGKLINTGIVPSQEVLLLRTINAIYSTLTVYVLYLLSSLYIRSPLLRLLPSFLLTNTLMFAFLGGGVNYDNLANLLSLLAIYCLAKYLVEKSVRSAIFSLAWVSLGCLTKVAIVPLAGLILLVIIYQTIRDNKYYLPRFTKKTISEITIIFSLLVIMSTSIFYVRNLALYKGLIPECIEILTPVQCELSPAIGQQKKLGLPTRMTILEAIKNGYPSPLEYTPIWIDQMAMRTFGILAHKNFFQHKLSTLIMMILIFLSTLNLFDQSVRQRVLPLYFIGMCFLGSLMFYNYFRDELLYKFQNVGVQGRYGFPVIGLFYLTTSHELYRGRLIQLKKLGFISLVALLMLSGPLVFIIYPDRFANWFLP